MNRADSLQQRIDALKRQCRTGYSCGSTCISLRKECRTSPGSAIGKERLQRLMALAAGGASSQRGIAPVKATEAGEMAVAITTRRGEKAGQLRGGRQQAAAEKVQAAQAAEAAAKAAAQARQPRPSAGDRPMAPAGTPRGEADRAAKAADPDYEFARPSAVGNVGEDLKGSARHKANQWRTLAEAEADGTAAAMVTRDKLLKAEPLDLTEGLTNANYLTRLAGHLALKSFPAQPYTDKAFAAYELGQITGKKTPAEMRKLYYDHLQEVKGIIDRRRDDADPREMLAEISRATSNRVAAIRGDRSQPNADRFNPLANSLVDLTKKAGRSSYSKSSVAGQINTLAVRLKKASDGKSTAELADVMRNATQEILGGASIDKVTGVQRGGATINAADLYVKRAVRTGGRSLGVDDSPAGFTTVLANRLGMRGLQFGNSVTDDERAHHLRKTAEAMVDLADVTGLPDRAMSLDGQLGLAFGARGKGRAAAHYEPGTKVINITRKNGVGTLAHEWGHALDDFIGQQTPRGQSRMRADPAYLSEQTSGLYWDRNGGTKSQADNPVWKAMDSVRKAIDDTDYRFTLKEGLEGYGIKAGSAQYSYWTSGREVFARTFERYVQHKLRSKGQENTYLSGLGGESPLWPNKEQIAKMAPALDELMKAVGTNTFGGMKRRTDSREERIQRLILEAMGPDRAPYPAGEAMDSMMPPTSFATLQERIDAVKRKCATGYSCGASCISMSKQCRKTPSAGPAQQKMTRILALAAGKEGGPAVSGGARAKEAPSSRGGSEKASEGQGKASGSTPKPMTISEMRSAVFKSFNVKSTAALMANKNFQQSVVGDKPRTLKGKNAEEEWRQLYRRFVSVPRDERGLKDGGSVINGVDILKNFRPWVAFGLDPKKATKADVDKAFRKLAMKHHPDAGGDRKVFEKLVSMKNSVKALMDSVFQDRLDALQARFSSLNG
jgi:hypothetical protein